MPAAAVGASGVPVSVGLSEKTANPVPVSSVSEAAKFAEVSLRPYPVNVVGLDPAVARPYVSTVIERYVPAVTAVVARSMSLAPTTMRVGSAVTTSS